MAVKEKGQDFYLSESCPCLFLVNVDEALAFLLVTGDHVCRSWMSSTVAQLKGLRHQPPDWSSASYGRLTKRESWLPVISVLFHQGLDGI